MITFKYSGFAKFIYRYANIPSTIILLIHLLYSLAMLLENWIYIFPLTINALVIYFINRFYLKSYKTFHFRIETDNEKMICKDFINKNKVVDIYYTEITNITGGIFSGNAARPIYIHTHKHVIGFHAHLRDFNKLITIILSNIPQVLYNDLLGKIKELGETFKERRAKKK